MSALVTFFSVLLIGVMFALLRTEWLAQFPVFWRLAFSIPVRRSTWRKIAVQSQNNMSLADSLEALRGQAAGSSHFLFAIFSHVLALKDAGATLDEAFAGLATPDELDLIASGQESGKLSEALLMAADILEAKQAIHSSVWEVVAYPLLIFSMVIATLLVISVYAMPELIQLSDPEMWTGFAYGLYVVSKFSASWMGLISMVMLAALIAIIIVTLPTWIGPLRLKVENIPPWSFYRLITGTTWLYSLSILMRSGKQLSTIIDESLRKSHITPYLAERLEAFRLQYGDGVDFGTALFNSEMQYPSPQIINELRTYASLPGFDERLVEISRQWMTDGISLIKTKSKIFTVVCGLAIIALICVLGIAVMDMQKQMMHFGG